MGQPVTGGAAATNRYPWPFISSLAHTAQGVGVPRRQEVEFADGSRIWLMSVERDGHTEPLLRELGAPAMGAVVDLGALVPCMGAALLRAKTPDVPHLVHLGLRERFGSVLEFLQAAIAAGRPA
jgi:hypothetical protein